jgi:DNA-binding NarL/FixJ family response regulator
VTGPAQPVRVVVADDQAAIRTGLVMILDAAPDLTVVGESADGLAAVAMARDRKPDVVLMDIRMPGIDGIEATTKTHVSRVLTKLGLRSRVQAAIAAQDACLVD